MACGAARDRPRAGCRVDGRAQFGGDPFPVLLSCARATTDFIGGQQNRHIAISHATHGQRITQAEGACQLEGIKAAQRLRVQRDDHVFCQQGHIAVAVGGSAAHGPGRAGIGGDQHAAIAHRGHDGLTGHRDRAVIAAAERHRLRLGLAPGLSLVLRQINRALFAAGDRHLHGVRHRHVLPLECLGQVDTHHLALAGHHQRKLHARKREANRIQARQVFPVDLAVFVGIGQWPAIDAGKSLQIAAAHRHDIVADGAAVFEHQVAGGLFKAQVAAHIEEVAGGDFHRAAGADQGALVAVNV